MPAVCEVLLHAKWKRAELAAITLTSLGEIPESIVDRLLREASLNRRPLVFQLLARIPPASAMPVMKHLGSKEIRRFLLLAPHIVAAASGTLKTLAKDPDLPGLFPAAVLAGANEPYDARVSGALLKRPIESEFLAAVSRYPSDAAARVLDQHLASLRGADRTGEDAAMLADARWSVAGSPGPHSLGILVDCVRADRGRAAALRALACRGSAAVAALPPLLDLAKARTDHDLLWKIVTIGCREEDATRIEGWVTEPARLCDALYLLGRGCPPTAARFRFLSKYAGHEDPRVRAVVASVLASYSSVADPIPALARLAEDSVGGVAENAIGGFRELPVSAAVLESLRHAIARGGVVAGVATKVLRDRGYKGPVPELLDAVHDADAGYSALRALKSVSTGDEARADALLKQALAADDPHRRIAAAAAMIARGGADDALLGVLRSAFQDRALQRAAFSAICDVGRPEDFRKEFRAALGAWDVAVRLAALDHADRFGMDQDEAARAAVQCLSIAVVDENGGLSEGWAAEVLSKCGVASEERLRLSRNLLMPFVVRATLREGADR